MEETPEKGITSPDDPTHEATTPPGNGDANPDAVKKSEEELGKAGGGH